MKNEYEVRGDITAIFLKKRDGSILETIINTSDLEKIKMLPNRWHSMYSKKTKSFYCVSDIRISSTKKQTSLLHRVIADTPDGMVTDHINHQTLDNRKANLRNLTVAENNQNRDKQKLRKDSNIFWNEQMQKWVVYASHNSKTKNLGSFKGIDEARKKLIDFKKKYAPYSQEALNNAD